MATAKLREQLNGCFDELGSLVGRTRVPVSPLGALAATAVRLRWGENPEGKLSRAVSCGEHVPRPRPRRQEPPAGLVLRATSARVT